MQIEDTSSVFAEEGTLAHEFADLELRIQTYTGKVGKGSQKQKWIDEKEALKDHELYNSEMDEYVAVYVGYVLEEFSAAKKKTPDAELKIEEKVDFSHLVPDGFGTCDVNIIADGVVDVIDFKYGKGVKVEARRNSQMRLYGVGALQKYDLLYDITDIKMTIVQPRLHHIASEQLSVNELTEWAVSVVQPAAEMAYEGKGDCNPGDWCRWCKAKPRCRALADSNMKLAKADFADPKTLSDEELLKVYKASGLLTEWANAVSGYILKEALDGRKWDGYKLVEGRANRKWADEKKALEVLLDRDDLKYDEVVTRKIKGIGAVEKKIGKPEFLKLDLTIKPQGKPTLAEESDKRPALGIDQAKEDFK